ncbi:MAG: uracil-DNA glycosylase family protein [Deltaproteobacteria bacterium]|nr:uracil-DNA glycosylase family protein [Deltaproteobacteria bacterium]
MTLTDQLKAECASRSLNYIGIRGNPYAPICVVGEAPGADEDQAGLPFVGTSGKEQDRMLSEAGIDPTDVWFTNPYKVRPPENDLSALHTLGIPLTVFENQFFEELRTYRPAVIIAAGATPMRLLCPQTAIRGHQKQPEYPIGKWRGSLLTSSRLPWPHYVIPVQHPTYILREWSERQISVMVYQRACEEWTYVHKNGLLNSLPLRQVLLAPSYEMLSDRLRVIADQRQRISVDIEILWQRESKKFNTKSGRLLYTIALAVSPYDGLAFCFWDYSTPQLANIFKLLNQALKNNRQIGQNYLSFDCHWLAAVGLEPNVDLVDDTLIGHHVMYLELPHTLAFQTMQYTREPYYKDEGRQWYVGDDKRQLLKYNVKDALVTFEIQLAQEEERNGK